MALPASPQALASSLPPGRLLLLLDYDGVLVEMAPTPDQARPDEALLSLLAGLAGREDTTVAVVSGRAPGDLLRLLPVPGLVVAACHGAALVTDGRTRWLVDVPVPGLSAFAALARRLTEGRPGFLVEEKGAAVALHYRLADPREAEYVRRELALMCETLVSDAGLQWLPGHAVLEVRHPGASKGRAVSMLVARYGGFPVYLGDDRTDEEAFQALAGSGLSVLVAAADRPTAADRRLSSPADVRRFLRLLDPERG